MTKILITLKDITVTGGAERVCVNLANALSNRGYEVIIASFYQVHAAPPPYELCSRVKLRAFSHINPWSKNLFAKLFVNLLHRTLISRKIDRFITQTAPDIVIANDGWYLPPRSKSTPESTPLYYRISHLNAPRFSARKVKNFARFDKIILLSGKELSAWQQIHDDISIIPNFLPTLPTRQADLSRRRVIAVGRLVGQKGFLRLVEIWALVQQHECAQGWELAIIGSGSMQQELESKITELGLQDTIKLKPFTSDMESEYLAASMFVMSSHFEALPMVLLESASYGLPAVAFDVKTGPSDIIEHGSSGYLVENGDLQGFAHRVLELMGNETKRASFGRTAAQIVAQRFSKQAILPLWDTILGE